MNTTKNTDLSKKAVTVTLRFSGYCGVHKNTELAKEAAQAHEADEDSITAKVRALRPETVKAIAALRSRAKTLWRIRTLPLDDEGRRLCPVRTYVGLRDALEAIKVEWLSEVQKIIDDYDNIVADGKKRLNGLWEKIPFPSKQALASMYQFRIQVGAIAKPSQIQLDMIGDDIQAQIRQEVEQSQQQLLEESHRELVQRAERVIKYLVDRLDAKTNFKNSLTGNVKKVADEIDELNIIGSKSLSDFANKMREKLTVDADTLRDDKKAVKEVKKAAKDLLGELANFEF